MAINILYFPKPARGGIERNFALWYGTGQRRHEVKIASARRPDFCPQEDHMSHRFAGLVGYLRGAAADEVRIFVFRGVALPLLLKAAAALVGRSVKIFYRANNDPGHWRHERSLKRAVAEAGKTLLLRFYDGIVFNSHELARRGRLYGSTAHVLPNPIDARDKVHFTSAKTKRFLFVGRKSRQKNLGNLIDAFRALGPDYSLHLAGVKPDALRLPDNVTAVDWQDDALPFDGFNYFVLPSFYEGAPNALLEAVNHGLLPVLTPFHSGGREIIEKFDIPAVIADGFAAADIAKAVRQMSAQKVNEYRQTPHCLSMAAFEEGLDGLFG